MLKALYFANQTVSKVVQMPIYVNQEVAFNKEKAQVGALSGYCVCRCQSWRTLYVNGPLDIHKQGLQPTLSLSA